LHRRLHGRRINHARYDSFGNQTSSGGSLSNTFRYTGREWDQETGLYYYRARHYDPTAGRFVSEDPIKFAGGPNFYGYVRNTPIQLPDPSGLFPPRDHRNLTNIAAQNAGYSPEEAKALADGVVDVDFLPHSQDTDGDHTNMHAMSGKKPDGSYQSCAEAYAATQAQLARYIANGNSAAIAAALHIIQDSYSPAHSGYQPWNGGYSGLHIPGPVHGWGDIVADHSKARLDALVASQQFLRDLREHSSALKYPSNYLKACECKQK
jgi:RHS repeat-associated protein